MEARSHTVYLSSTNTRARASSGSAAKGSSSTPQRSGETKPYLPETNVGSPDQLTRTSTNSSSSTGPPNSQGHLARGNSKRKDNLRRVSGGRGPEHQQTKSRDSNNMASISAMNSPYRYQDGRRYLRDSALAYPLPVDLTELHRQLMRTLLCMRLHGKPFRNKVFDDDNPPKKVLEVACGTALWSSACHDYFKGLGHEKVNFTGVDLAPLPPDLKGSGMDWKFVNHDIRNGLAPFADNEFDFIFIKDFMFLRQDGIVPRQNPLAEVLRILKPGGVIEIWESDYVFRTLIPNPTMAKDLAEEELELAKACAVYPIDSSTSFAQTRNIAISQYNGWLESALEKRHLPAAPCAYITWMFTAHADELDNYGNRRIAVPFCETRWEKENNKPPLNDYQLSLRQSALQNCLDFMDALEPLLKEESGKRQDEWDRWKAGLVSELMSGNGAVDGECLELGAWWATKY